MKKLIYAILLIDLFAILFFMFSSCNEVEFVSTNYDIHTYSGKNYNIKMDVRLVKHGNKVYKTNKFGTRVFRKKDFEFHNDSVTQRDNVAKIIYK